MDCQFLNDFQKQNGLPELTVLEQRLKKERILYRCRKANNKLLAELLIDKNKVQQSALSRYSVPGWRIDYTVLGALSKGYAIHTVETILRECPDKLSARRNLSFNWRVSVWPERPVSAKIEARGDSYLDIVESLRIYIVNPALLSYGRPKRFAFIQDKLLLKAIRCTDDWQQNVYCDVTEDLIKATDHWKHIGELHPDHV